MIYLASPYTGDEEENYYRVMSAINLLRKSKISAFSPILYWRPLAYLHSLPKSYEAYRIFDEEMITICDRFCILDLDGWADSQGIAKEIRWAKLNGKLIEMLNFKELRKGKVIINFCTM